MLRFQQYEIRPPGAPAMRVQIVEMTHNGTTVVGTQVDGDRKWNYHPFSSWDEAVQTWGQS